MNAVAEPFRLYRAVGSVRYTARDVATRRMSRALLGGGGSPRSLVEVAARNEKHELGHVLDHDMRTSRHGPDAIL